VVVITNAHEFRIQLDREAKILPASIVDFQRRLTIEGLNRVCRLSPVKTGRFHDNHNVSVGAPDLTFDEDRRGSSKGSPPTARQLSEAKARLASLTLGHSTFIASGAPYGEMLEDGSSQQAPAGVYRIVAQQLDQMTAASLGMAA